MSTIHKKLNTYLGIFALIFASLACSSIQLGVVQPTAANQTQPDVGGEEVVSLDDPTVIPLVAAPEQGTQEPDPDPQSSLEVTAWLGRIASLPESSQFDDMVVLSPPETGEFGLAGATPELEAEIRTLRDAEGPHEYVHLWGELVCGIEDYNACRLSVEKLQYGANYSEEEVEAWVGTIVGATFNSAQTYVFKQSGDFPMRYSLRASQDEALQSVIENLMDTGAVVQVGGRLLVGVPDVNGTRIEVSNLKVLEPGTSERSEPEASFDPTADWPVFVNDRYNYQIRHPREAVIILEGPVSFSMDEKPEGMSAEAYMDSLLKEYTDRLCIRIQYSLGWVNIAAPPNKEKMMNPCGPTGVGAGELITKIELVQIGDKLYSANGHEIKLQLLDSEAVPFTGETLDMHSEMYYLELEDGTVIRFGSTPTHDATYEDYLMKTREVLLQIIGSYESLE
jgi:hypothetical protein